MARKRKEDEKKQLGSERPFKALDAGSGGYDESTVRSLVRARHSGEPISMYFTPEDQAEARRRGATPSATSRALLRTRGGETVAVGEENPIGVTEISRDDFDGPKNMRVSPLIRRVPQAPTSGVDGGKMRRETTTVPKDGYGKPPGSQASVGGHPLLTMAGLMAYGSFGSTPATSDLSPGLNADVLARARAEQRVSGDAPIDAADPNAPTLRAARSMRADNDRKAAQTSELRGKIDAVQTGNTKPNWSGYLQGRGISDEKIRAVRALNGQTNAPATPVNAVGPKKDAADAQERLQSTERFEKTGGESVQDAAYGYGVPSGSIGLTTAQRNDPAYKLRVESARQASAEHQERQKELDAIRKQVQDQRYAEALMGRGRGIQNRAADARQNRMNRIATRGLNPEDRAGVLLERRGQEYQQSAVQQEIQARRAELEMQRQAEATDRNWQAGQNDADRGSAEKIAETRANAPAGNRGAADERQAKQRRDDTIKSFEDSIKRMESLSADSENPMGEYDQMRLNMARPAKSVLLRNPETPLFEYPDEITAENFDQVMEEANLAAKEDGLADGTQFIVYNPNSNLPMVLTYKQE